MTAMQQIIARASNRVFVGLPVCKSQRMSVYWSGI